MMILFILTVAVVCSTGHPNVVKRQASPFAYSLPSNTSVIVGEVSTEFKCTGREYGYYADQNNSCQIFHVCLPSKSADDIEQMRMWSFLCGEGTIFDQSQLVCNYPEFSLPCAEASDIYNINDYFREENEDREFRDGLNDIF